MSRRYSTKRGLYRERSEFGRPSKLTPRQAREVIERRTIKGESLTEIAKSFNVSHTTIMQVMREMRARHAEEAEPARQLFKFASARRASTPQND